MPTPKPLPAPILMDQPQGWLPRRETPPGEWLEWQAAGIDGWTLKAWPIFEAQIRLMRHLRPPQFSVDINQTTFGLRPTLEAAKAAAELEMVQRVQGMLPAYRAIHARVKARR